MANHFEISLSNPIRFVTEKVYNPSLYWNRHFDDTFAQFLLKNYQSKAYYNQKYAFADNPKVQILSDFEDILVELVNLHTEEVEDTFDAVEVASTIVGHTFKVYEFECDFNVEGCYTLRVSYVNQDDETIIYYSEPLEIKEVHENTLRLDVTNSTNEDSLIFNAGFTCIFRVEADIINYTPASKDTIYIDQEYNATQLYSVAYRKFTFVLGSTLTDFPGLPDWVIDKVNRLLSFDTVLFDGKQYCKDEGAQFEEQRLEGYPFTAQTIDILESENKSQLSLDTSFLDEEMINLFRRLTYLAATADITISNIFKDKTSLFQIYAKNSGAPFDLEVADEDGAICTQSMTTGWNVIDARKTYSSLKDVYLNGITGNLCDVYVIWLKLDAVTAGSSNPYASLGVGAVVMYMPATLEILNADFNLTTKYGTPETDWEGWRICDGSEGTVNPMDRLPMGTDGITIGKEVGTLGGSDTHTLLVGQLPKHRVKLFGTPVTTSSAIGTDDVAASITTAAIGEYRYGIVKSLAGEPTVGKSSEVGNDEAVSHIPKFWRCMYVRRMF